MDYKMEDHNHSSSSSSIFMKCRSCSDNVERLKILPCLHTFCFKCLDTTNKSELGDKVFCSECKITFERPEKEKLNKSSSSTLSDQCNSLLCGICSQKNAEKFCIDCKICFCVSCSSVHERLPFTKEHSFVSYHSTDKKLSEIRYCTSCEKWLNGAVESDHYENHRSCTIIDMLEYGQNLQGHLLELTTQDTEDIAIVRKDVNYIDEEEIDTEKLAQLLKRQIEYQSEKLKTYVKTCISNRVNELNECIDDELQQVEEKLGFSKKHLLEKEAEVDTQINKYENMVIDFNEQFIVKAIDEDLMKKLSMEKYDILSKRRKIASTLVSEKLRLSFEPAPLQGDMFVENNIVGAIKRVRKSHPDLIKVLKLHSPISRCSIVKSKLYGLSVSGEKRSTFSKLSLKSYELLDSFSFKTDNFLYIYVFVDQLLCAMPNNHCSQLTVYDLEKRVGSNEWKRYVNLSFSAQNLFATSGSNNLFVLSHQRIIEITLYGDIVNEIQLPSGCQPRDFVRLGNGFYASIYKGGLHLIDGNGNATKSFDARRLSRLGKLDTPCNMITDNSSNIFISNYDGQNVFVFDFRLNFIKQIVTKCSIQKLCYDSRKDHLLVIGKTKLNIFQL